ncbi:hypothetical protein D3C75_728670 [compost metagenome]
MRVAALRGARPGVPGAGVACADNDGVGLGVEAGALPRRAAAVAPGFDLAGFGGGIVRPGRCLDVTGRRAVLAVQAAHVALHEGPHPHFFARVRVTGEQLADHAELIAGAAVDQQHLAAGLVLDQHRGAGHGVAGGVVAELLVPHHFAGALVEGDDTRIEGAKVDLVAVDRRPAVDHVAAGTNVVGQAVVVGPQALAGFRIEGEYPRIRAGDIDHAVADDGLGFLAALLLVAEGIGPGRGQLEHVLVIDLGQRAPALGIGAHAVLQHVLGGQVVVGDVFPGDVLAGRCSWGGGGCGRVAQGQATGQQQGPHAQGQRGKGG